MEDKVFLIAGEDEGGRLDIFISEKISGVSRSYAKKLIEEGRVSADGVCAKPSKIIAGGTEITVSLPEAKAVTILPQDIPLDIVYEDKDLAVVNKQQGLVVHPSGGVYEGTLVNALLFHIDDLSGINGYLRPGIVHRLDKDTSGLMLVAKNDSAHRSLASQIASKECSRVYYGLVEGVVKENGAVDMPIARSQTDRKKMAVSAKGRPAKTIYSVIENYRQNTLIRFELTTGRTHQIRVHAKYIGHPVVGDAAYGYKTQRFNLNGQLLHSKELSFVHPSGNTAMSFSSNLPLHFTRVLDILEKEKSTR